MPLLERAIRFAAPGLAARRARARAQAAAWDRARIAYDGASVGRRTAGWRPTSTTANAEISNAGARLRAVAHELCRNNPYAVRGRTTIVNAVVGAGVIPSATGPARQKKKLERLLKEHLDTTAIDPAGQSNLYAIQAQVMGCVVESGEALVVRRWRPSSWGLPLPFQIQVLEPDFLDTSKDGPTASGGQVWQGIEFDARGRRVAYHLFTAHPGEMWSVAKSVRVPAADVAHVYRIDRPGQARGVTWFAPVMLRLHDLNDFIDAQLVRQKIAACFAGFETMVDHGEGPDVETDGDAGTDAYPVEDLEPGLMTRLRPGAKMEWTQPPQLGDFEPYLRANLREISVGLGITYEVTAGDLRQVNFSSGRMGWIEQERNVGCWRGHMFLPQLCEPIGRWTLEAAAIAHGIDERAGLIWTPPQREMLDPKKETEAAKDAIRAGFNSRQDEIRRRGRDPEDVDREIAEDNARADADGLAFDSDGRRPSNGGPIPQTDEDTDDA